MDIQEVQIVGHTDSTGVSTQDLLSPHAAAAAIRAMACFVSGCAPGHLSLAAWYSWLLTCIHGCTATLTDNRCVTSLYHSPRASRHRILPTARSIFSGLVIIFFSYTCKASSQSCSFSYHDSSIFYRRVNLKKRTSWTLKYRLTDK